MKACANILVVSLAGSIGWCTFLTKFEDPSFDGNGSAQRTADWSEGRAELPHAPELWSPVWMARLGPREIAQMLGEPADQKEILRTPGEELCIAMGAGFLDRDLDTGATHSAL